MTSPRQVLILSCLFVAVVSGCGSTKPEAIPTTTSTTTQQTPAEVAVIHDYRAFWDDYLAVTNPMVPGNPRISAHATGDELTALNGIVLAGHQNGSVFRGAVDLAPHVENVAGDTALVADCTIDHTGQYALSDGHRIDKEDLTPQNLNVTLTNISGVWKVAAIDHRSAPCTP